MQKPIVHQTNVE